MLANGVLEMKRTPPSMVALVASSKPTSVLGKMSSEMGSLPINQTVECVCVCVCVGRMMTEVRSVYVNGAHE